MERNILNDVFYKLPDNSMKSMVLILFSVFFCTIVLKRYSHVRRAMPFAKLLVAVLKQLAPLRGFPPLALSEAFLQQCKHQ